MDNHPRSTHHKKFMNSAKKKQKINEQKSSGTKMKAKAKKHKTLEKTLTIHCMISWPAPKPDPIFCPNPLKLRSVPTSIQSLYTRHDLYVGAPNHG
jgi:hypothetical protein